GIRGRGASRRFFGKIGDFRFHSRAPPEVPEKLRLFPELSWVSLSELSEFSPSVFREFSESFRKYSKFLGNFPENSPGMFRANSPKACRTSGISAVSCSAGCCFQPRSSDNSRSWYPSCASARWIGAAAGAKIGDCAYERLQNAALIRQREGKLAEFDRV